MQTTLQVYMRAVSESVLRAKERLAKVVLDPIGPKSGKAASAKTGEGVWIQSVNGAPGATRTPDLWFRRPALYPTELQARGPAPKQSSRLWSLVRKHSSALRWPMPLSFSRRRGLRFWRAEERPG